MLGNLGVHVRHIITYSLSPYEQRAFAGFLSRDIPRMLKRMFIAGQNMLPGLGTAGGVYYVTSQKAKRMEREEH